MQLPVDVKALIDEMTNVDAARSTEISLSVYVDPEAPADLVAHIRGAYASSLATVRMTLSYLDGTFVPNPTDDIAVVVAGGSAKVGAAAAAIRAVGVPTMVVTTLPGTVAQLAEEDGHAVPDGDIAAPHEADGSAEPFDLDEQAAAALDERMGSWIVSVCRDKRMALAVAFPFMRRALATDAVQLTSIQNAGIGLVPIIPGADFPIMTLNQAKMVLQIAAAYGYEMDKSRVKELLAVIGGAYLFRGIARKIVGAVPVLGIIVRPGIAYGGTAAIGYSVIEYFEGGQSVAGVASAASNVGAWSGKAANAVKDTVERIVPVVSSKVAEYAPVAEKIVRSVVAGEGFPEGNLLEADGKGAVATGAAN